MAKGNNNVENYLKEYRNSWLNGNLHTEYNKR